MASRSASFDPRTRSEESWVEIASQPSSSSLSSIGDEIITTGLRVQNEQRARRRRTLRQSAPSTLATTHRLSRSAGASSQEEYEESESESDRVMTSSNEGFIPSITAPRADEATSQQSSVSDDDDENRTAINYPMRNEECFTPQPNAFSHPPSVQSRTAGQQLPSSYFPSQRRESRSTLRPSSLPQQDSQRPSHLPQNILSPSYDAATQHEEALRTSLSTLLSCAAAARNLSKPSTKRHATTTTPQQQPPRSTRIEPMSFRLIPESALPATRSSPPQFHEPTFHPTLRRQSTSTSASSQPKENKRKAATTGRSSSRERNRTLKKARRTHASSEDLLQISPTLLTWVVSAGVVVFLSALSFSAGYGIGKEAGRLEASGWAADHQVRSCAREAGRSGLGLKRSLARSAVQV